MPKEEISLEEILSRLTDEDFTELHFFRSTASRLRERLRDLQGQTSPKALREIKELEGRLAKEVEKEQRWQEQRRQERRNKPSA